MDSGPPRLGLALSGGGFRAAAFHLGVLRGLRAAGLLDAVTVVSGVSGGAMLAAAWVATGLSDFEAFDARTRAFLGRDLKRRVVRAALHPGRLLRLLADPTYSLTEVMAEVLDRDILGGTALGALNGVHPRLVLNATCINHGTAFRFAPDRIGDWLLSTESREVLDAFPLARAVAASAAFPGGLAPVVLSGELFAHSAHPPREVLLTDGGVDDNFGAGAFAQGACTHLVVSDGSSPFPVDREPLDRYGLALGRRILGATVAGALCAALGPWLGVPAAVLFVAVAMMLVLALRLRLALFLFGSVMMRGQRRGVLRRLFAGTAEVPALWVGLTTPLIADAEARLAARGISRAGLSGLPTDLDLAPRDVDALVALGEEVVRHRLAASDGFATLRGAA